MASSEIGAVPARPSTSVRLAKLSRPSIAGAASRQRLFAALDRHRERSVVWVAGPAGSGKTTLAAEYLDTFAVDYCWYQLDQGDADVATFFYYLAQALHGRGEGGQASLPSFSAEYLDDLPAYTRRFFRAFFDQLAGPFALVFDNYHEVPAQSRLHEVIRDGLDEIPDGGCVVIVGRAEPPAAYARLRANQRMAVVTGEDLKLTREEFDEVVDLRGLELAELARAQLYERTQGWVAGVVLMLEHLRSQGKVADLPATFTPNVIFDYLAGEVIMRVDEDQRQFLMQTALLPFVTAELADGLMSRTDSASVLESLAHQDSFISIKPIDGEIAYQYHPLLREFLQKRARDELGAAAHRALQVRAACLLEQADQVEGAIGLLIDGEEWSEVTRLVKEHASSLLRQGRRETLELWLEELPRAQLRTDPWLAYWLASCRMSSGPRESRRQYELAYDLFRSSETPDVDGLFRALAGVLGAILYDLDDLTLLDRWIVEVEGLLERYPDFPAAEYGQWTTCYTYMALVLRQPFHADIESWGERVYGIFQTSRDLPVRLQAAIVLVSGIVWTGRFTKVTEIIESIRELADAPQESPFVLTTLHVVESMNYMLDGQYDRCMAAVRSGLEVAKNSGIHIWENSTLLNGVGGALGEGDLETAEELLGRLDSSALGLRRYDSCIYHFFCAWLAMLKNDSSEAYRQQRTALRLATEMGLPFFEVIGGIAMAQILFECGEQRKGVAHLSEVRRVAKKINNHYLEFMSLLFYADLALKHGRKTSALTSLAYAFKLGREMRYTNMIWWQPRMMSRLAATALENDIETDYTRQLIRRRKLLPDSDAMTIPTWPWRYRARVFGGFSLMRDDDPDAFRGKHGKPLDLLKVLIAFGGQDINIDRITDVLWPRIDADFAHRSLNTTLHRLRRLLGDDEAVVLQGGKLSLDARWFWTDVRAIEHAIAAGNEYLGLSGSFAEPDAVLRRAVDVLDLYTGPFMKDEDAAWVLAAREAWQRKVVRFLTAAARHLADHGRLEEAMQLLERGIEADELAEALYRQLMSIHQSADRFAEAVEVFERCRRVWRARLSREPSQETLLLFEKIAQRA